MLAAVATPTPDPFTMTLAMAPLIVLFELSILLARWIERIKPVPEPSARWDDDEDDDERYVDEEHDEDDDELDADPGDEDPDGLRADLTKLMGPDRKD